eukprot:CAMPEP_0171679080 /NCGR_PEP_ID=MMETSP0990-20121206/56038_1 /TAXON_ID=483369 /ORGANISM="non described non described, Strain CCMP2098" /LENGTH=72 /DNA_ID=CAMNT_0012265825 /DNA_START=217 /DNA_END=438 /DNA_ORIENTATION=+
MSGHRRARVTKMPLLVDTWSEGSVKFCQSRTSTLSPKVSTKLYFSLKGIPLVVHRSIHDATSSSLKGPVKGP